ncbi:hypothetical protein FHG87_014216 [Trinorchestia longiramus]|nr:hypothetical protein FHG87_014216 [Trinorchestia longiramus]
MRKTCPVGHQSIDQEQKLAVEVYMSSRTGGTPRDTGVFCSMKGLGLPPCWLLLLLLCSVLCPAHTSARANFESESAVGSAVDFAPSYGSNVQDYDTSEEDYQDGGLSAQNWPEEAEFVALESPKIKKWTGPEERNRARMLYNYLLSRRFGGDIFGKRMGSSYPMNKFRFFTSDPSAGGGGIHGSEFLGKRARISEFLGKRDSEDSLENYEEVNGVSGKRARVSEFLGKRARVSQFSGKRARVSEFLGKRSAPPAMSEKRARISEFLGKRARVSEFLGKRDDGRIEMPEKKARVSEFLGKRVDPSRFYGKRARISEFLGKRLTNPYDFSNKRTRVSEFLGKRSRVSEFLGKRSGSSDFGQDAKVTLNDTTADDHLLSGSGSDETSKISDRNFV